MRASETQGPDTLLLKSECCRLHEDVKAGTASKGKLLKLLHGRCTELKKEIKERLHTDSLTIKPVMRTYAFEDERISPGPQWVLKVVCSVAPGKVRADLSGRNFSAVLGTTQTPLEALQLKRKIMGPCWLSLNNATEATDKLSWCKVLSISCTCTECWIRVS